jgi:hypothetical protein
VTSTESGTELDLSFGIASSTSIRPLLDESVRFQEELDRIFWISIPYILEIGEIYFDEEDFFNKQDKHKNNEKKRRKSRITLV